MVVGIGINISTTPVYLLHIGWVFNTNKSKFLSLKIQVFSTYSTYSTYSNS